MTESIAVLDTDVAIMILDTRKVLDPPTYSRRERALQAIDDARKRGARCMVTAPTIVELSSYKGGGGKAAVLRLRTFITGLRVMGLTVDAAEAAGAMLMDNLKGRPVGKSRNEIKFDALIASIAHAIEAKWLITGNAKDYVPLFREIRSSVHVVDVDAITTLGKQLSISEVGLKK